MGFYANNFENLSVKNTNRGNPFDVPFPYN